MKVVFTVADVDAEEQLIREYIAPKIQQIEGCSGIQWPIFNRYGQDPSVEKGEVAFYIFGDIKSFIDDEQSYWDKLIDNNLILNWEIVATDMDISELNEQEKLRYRLRSVASRMSLEVFENFETTPDSLGGYRDDEHSVGWNLCLHHIINQLGYQSDDGEEEIDLLFQCLVSRLYARAVTPGYGTTSTEMKIEELVSKLESLPSEMQSN